MASNPELKRTIQEIAAGCVARWADIPAGKDAEALFGALGGSLYALRRAFDLGYEDRTGKRLPGTYREELYALFQQIAEGEPPRDGQWLAGFYFHSALRRLAALYHRPSTLRRIERQDLSALREVSHIVNNMKHKPTGNLTRNVRQDVAVQDVAVDAAKEALKLLKRALCEQQTR
jgi:hypothetical protein